MGSKNPGSWVHAESGNKMGVGIPGSKNAHQLSLWVPSTVRDSLPLLLRLDYSKLTHQCITQFVFSYTSSGSFPDSTFKIKSSHVCCCLTALTKVLPSVHSGDLPHPISHFQALWGVRCLLWKRVNTHSFPVSSL